MENITYHRGSVSHSDRRRITGTRPLVVWFTGLSGSGKSTVASAVEAGLSGLGYAAYLLDGDNLRHGLNSNLGFSESDRAENIRRIAETAALLADSAQIVLVSAISPLRSMRDAARARIEKVCGFCEVFCDASVGDCAARDPKGLYKKALAGEIKGFTGIDAPYEKPCAAEITLDTVSRTAEDCAREVMSYILGRQIDYDGLLDVIIPAVKRAGEAIMDIYGRGADSFGVEYKADKSPLTAADRASNDIICAILRENFPYYSILAEESADDLRRLRERYCFIVDPLDGTKEFIKRNGEFTVNVALSFDGASVLGVVYVPATETLYYAAKGKGAFKAAGCGAPERIHAGPRTDGLVVMESRSHGDARLDALLDKNKNRIARTVSAGSSLKGCLIAEGAADVYYRFGYTMEWDTAAMHCVCEEAGALVRQCDGTPLTYNRRFSLNEKGFYIVNRPENDFLEAERREVKK